MLWFFQGLERNGVWPARWEIGGQSWPALSILYGCIKPDDGWKVMAAQCGAGLCCGPWLFIVVAGLSVIDVGFRWPDPIVEVGTIAARGRFVLFGGAGPFRVR